MNYQNRQLHKTQKMDQKGFTILVAVVTAGVLLIISMSIGAIAIKEQTISFANKESKTAYFAAETGMECMMYLDQKMRVFELDSNNNSIYTNVFPDVPYGSCNGVDNIEFLEDNSVPGDADASNPTAHAQFSYKAQMDIDADGMSGAYNRTCVVMRITKDTNNTAKYNPDGSTPEIASRTHTTIESLGYDSCDSQLGRFQRGVSSTN